MKNGCKLETIDVEKPEKNYDRYDRSKQMYEDCGRLINGNLMIARIVNSTRRAVFSMLGVRL